MYVTASYVQNISQHTKTFPRIENNSMNPNIFPRIHKHFRNTLDALATRGNSTVIPDGVARLKTRSACWNRAGWEINILDGFLAEIFPNIWLAGYFYENTGSSWLKMFSLFFLPGRLLKKTYLTFCSLTPSTNGIWR